MIIKPNFPNYIPILMPHIKKVDNIIDIGPGIRPQDFFLPKRHIVIEPHDEYIEILKKEKKFEVHEGTALDILPKLEKTQSIFLLDVIEHMTKEEGKELLQICEQKASEQIILFTPIGFDVQSYEEGEKDAWGYNGIYWQTHRSGWTPDEFVDWDCYVNNKNFFAIRNLS